MVRWNITIRIRRFIGGTLFECITWIYTTMLDNLGKTKSSGIDLSLNGDVIRTKEFTWSLGTNFSMYKNEIVRIDDTLDENGKPASR